MEYKIKRVLPEEVFVSCTTQSRDDGIRDGGRRLSGIQVMDIIAGLIHYNGHLTRREMAKLLDISEPEVTHGVSLLSGIPYNEWRDRYLKLMHDYILRHEGKIRKDAVCARLGFPCLSTRNRFEKRMNRKG